MSFHELDHRVRIGVPLLARCRDCKHIQYQGSQIYTCGFGMDGYQGPYLNSWDIACEYFIERGEPSED